MVHRLLLSFGGRRRRTIPCLLFTDFLSLCDSSYAIPFVQSLNLAVCGRPGAGQGKGQKGSYGGGIVS